LNKDEDDDISDAKTDIEGIKADIRQGKEIEVIALKYDKSENYVRKIKREMVKQGIKLIDRRSREWRTKQFMRI